ncbi:hypothetical protein J6590_074373 [Homalodisca vitripennis]|nr:hypothetical protein J6590_074373 [Homalodisca vitripennis]
MNAYHLRKTEVIYELKIRNVDTDGNANELRKRVTQCFSADTQVDETVVNSLDADAESEECEGKYQDLSSLVSDYEGTNNDNEFHRIVARLWHLYLRVERIPIGASSDSEQAESKEKLLSRRTSDSKNQPDPRTSAGGFQQLQRPEDGAQETNFELPKTLELAFKPNKTTEDDENLATERKLLEEWRNRGERKLQ